MKRLALICLASMLPACTPLQWTKEGANPDQVDRDTVFCQQEGSRESRSYPRPPEVSPAVYGGVSATAGNQLAEASRLASFCMRSKGYALVRSQDVASAAQGSAVGATRPR